MGSPAQHEFNREFWTHYADRYPDDGVRRGFAGHNPQYRVPETDFIIKRYNAQRLGLVGLGVVTPENRSLLHGEQPSVKPYLPALEKALGEKPGERSGITELEIDILNRDNWQQAADWLHERLEIYRRILSQPPPESQE